jgi:MFS family permease
MTESNTGQPNRKLLGLEVNPGISGWNVTTFYFSCLAAILLASFMPQMQPYLLTEFLDIEQSRHGSVSGNLNFWAEMVIIFSVGLWGALSDRFGRKPVMVAGFLIMALGFHLYPTAESLNELLIYRLVYSAGIAAISCMLGTVLADYIANRSRGKGAGLQGVMNGLGAVITVFLLLRLPAIFQDSGMTAQQAGIATYEVVTGFCVFAALLMMVGIKGGRADSTAPSNGVIQVLRDGLVAARDPGVALAYGASFVARGNLAIVGTFLALWITNFASFEAGMSRADALAKAGMIVGIAQGITLLTAPFFGVLSDKINRVTALAVALGVSAVGYGATFFVHDPLSGGMIICAIVIGLGEIGCIITSGVLIAQQSPVHLRGAVVGFFNLTGALGILVASMLGGWLFDHWREAGPFVLFGFFALLAMFWALAMRNKVQPPPDSLGFA